MRKFELLENGSTLVRVLDIRDNQIFVINCKKNSAPKWVNRDTLTGYMPRSDEVLPDINKLDLQSRKVAYERFTLVSGVLPFITEQRRRSAAISEVAELKGVSKQTVSYYLWVYLSNQNISALAPKQKPSERQLTRDEKNFRWALNKFYYTRQKNTLTTAYTLLLKEKYCDENGVLLSEYPSFYQFRYFYRQHKKMQTQYISRDGLKHYQRNNRPLLGDGIHTFAPAIGVGMLDSTVCDIYLVNEEHQLVGRPLLTACVDAHSGLCCGYSLTWEGGTYSLKGLVANIIADKVEWCMRFGIDIQQEEWNCNKLPAVLVSDRGSEYAGTTFEQITDLGVTLTNLPPFRPELKSAVEKFFDLIQGSYKPYLHNKGIIQPDWQERGVRDYRRDACLTMNDFEKIIIRCILKYNNNRIIEDFPYTEEMLAQQVKPYSSCIWNYSLTQVGANLIETDYTTLMLTLAPRTSGKFTRKGLIVNKLRYKNDAYTEKYLSGGTATVCYNPDDASTVHLIENGKYVPFSLINQRFEGVSLEGVQSIRRRQNNLKNPEKHRVLEAKIGLATAIETIANGATKTGDTSIRDIRDNRRRERTRTHIDYLRGENDDE